MERQLNVQLEGILENQGLARAIAAAYASELDPTVDELTEIKTAVSEAFSNAVLHGYGSARGGADGEYTEKNGGFQEINENYARKPVYMEFTIISPGTIMIKISDNGIGIENVAKAMEPLFTTDTGQNRSGMGFTVMESFMDKLKVDSKPGKGTTVTMIKKLDTYYGF